MNSVSNNILQTTPSSDQPVTFTGQQLLKAFESQYIALRGQINNLNLKNQKLTNPSLLKQTALNSITFGEYKKLYEAQKTITNNQDIKLKFKAIEQKYTTQPHIKALIAEIKALESLLHPLIEVNNKSIATLTHKQSTILAEKRKLAGLEKHIFQPMTDKIAELPYDALYQSQIIRYSNQHTR